MEVERSAKGQAEEVVRLASLAATLMAQVEDFAKSHGAQMLLGRPVRAEAASDLACIGSDCRALLEGLERLAGVPIAEKGPDVRS